MSTSNNGSADFSEGRGFQSMDTDKRKEVAAEGGRHSHSGSHESKSSQHQQGSGTNAQQRAGGAAQKDSQDKRDSTEGSTRGGTPEQHANAGRQSHKNG